MSGVIHGKFHLDVIFLVGIFFSIDFNNVFLNRVQFSSIDFSHRFSDSNIKQKKSGQSNIPVLNRNTEILSEPKDKANVINDQYTSVFTREPPGQLPNIDGTPIPPMTDIGPSCDLDGS
jgi:hypothetical protein